MSFGYSMGDAFLLGQLAWRILQNSRKACGEHDELTREISAVHAVLQRLGHEVEKEEGLVNRSGETCREELQRIVTDCGDVLETLDKIMKKYAALGEEGRSTRKLWKSVRFGSGRMVDLGDLRSKVTFYTSAMTLYLNMISMGSIGRIEQQMTDSGGVLRDIQIAVNSISAQKMCTVTHEGSVLTSYSEDDKSVWKEFRRDLVREGFKSSIINKHKHLIKSYVRELESRGAWDESIPLVDEGNTQTSTMKDFESRDRTVAERCPAYLDASKSEQTPEIDRGCLVCTDGGPDILPPPAKFELDTSTETKFSPPTTEISVEMIQSSIEQLPHSMALKGAQNDSASAALIKISDSNYTETSLIHSIREKADIHELWHLYHDKLARQCIRWALNQYLLKLDQDFKYLFGLTQIIQIIQIWVGAMNESNSGSPSMWNQILSGDIKSMLSIMAKFTPPRGTCKSIAWADNCRNNLGYRVRVNEQRYLSIWLIESRTVGPRCGICYPPS